MPAGSTPIDFAYKIHSGVGNACVGAKVNGRIVPLDYKLKNSEIVEILTSSGSTGPSRDWLNIVKSSQARSKIRQWFKKERREENIDKGQETIDRELKRLALNISQSSLQKVLSDMAKRHGFSSTEDLYAAVGYGGITLTQVMPRIKEVARKKAVRDNVEKSKGHTPRETDKKKKKGPGQGVRVKGIGNIMVRFAKCCNPVPGDDIMGYVTKGRGVSIHRKDCLNLANTKDAKERWVEVEWDVEKPIEFQVEVQVKAIDRKGLLSDVTTVLSEMKISINSLNARTTKDQTAILNLILGVNDIEHLEELMKKLKNLRSIVDISRVTA
ncbi:MAG TPA: ACT domain-containing protein [Oscillospiraceae bacterium]|nr:ACT domain-containing protein [Oscillospiraceae bacterium]